MSVSVKTEVALELKLHPKEEAVYEPPLKLTVEVEGRDGSLNKSGIFITPQDLLDYITTAIEDMQGKFIGQVKGLAYLPHTLEMIITRVWERIQSELPYQVKVTELTLRKDDIFVVKYTVKEFERQPQPQLQVKPKAKARK
jgi:6-pyruvoyl-tetrahydropterin synthase